MTFYPVLVTNEDRVAGRTAAYLGCELAYWTQGNGPPVLFIQGTGLHGDGWLPQINALHETHACLWFDNRGMGRSNPAGSAAITLAQLSLDALRVLDAAHWKDAHVVGHSLGGCIALELALSQPERVRSLSLLCTAADGPGLVRLNLAMLGRGIRMNLGTRASRRNAFLEIILTRAQHAELDLARLATELMPLFGHDLAQTPPIVMKQVRAMSKWNALARLHELAQTPTLVVAAMQDLIARRELVRSTADAIPGARLVELQESAHGVTVTAPAVINELLRIHIAEVEARGRELDRRG